MFMRQQVGLSKTVRHRHALQRRKSFVSCGHLPLASPDCNVSRRHLCSNWDSWSRDGPCTWETFPSFSLSLCVFVPVFPLLFSLARPLLRSIQRVYGAFFLPRPSSIASTSSTWPRNQPNAVEELFLKQRSVQGSSTDCKTSD